VVTACASTRSIPDFKYAVSAEYYECDFRPEPCPDKDTPHVSIDPERFRRAVATAVHLKGKTWSKGWSLVRVKLPDGREKDYRVPSFGQAAVDPPSESGTWIFEPGADQEFEELMGAARRTAR
jgi:hypothetical protein